MIRKNMIDVSIKRILRAAAREFVEKGFNGVTMAQIAKRARLSRQLVHHYFPSKAGLLKAVNEKLYRPKSPWEVEIPSDLTELIADRFARRALNLNYMRVLAWEAASVRNGAVPGERERKERITAYGSKIKALQADGLLPADMDHRMIHLTINALATYPLVFNQTTRLVTGKAGTDPKFQKEWATHVRKLARLWLLQSSGKAAG